MTTVAQLFDGVFDADVNHSSFEAGARHMGVGSFRTRFEDVSARLVADASGLRLEGAAKVESVSIRHPREFREHVVYGEDFFDAYNHPIVRFSSERIALDPDGTLELTGDLTIKGVTRQVVASGTYRPPTEDPYGSLRAAMDLSTVVDRRDFGMGWQAQLPKGGDVLGWDIEIDVHLEFTQV